MKNLLNKLSTVACVLSLSLNAQTNKTASSSSAMDVQSDPSDSKAKYVANQDYLSKSSLKDYKNYYGDSLKGFNEAAVRADLITRYKGEEFINAMNFNKRDFINKKYKLGYYSAKTTKTGPYGVPSTPTTPTPAKGKPIGGGNNIVNLAPCVNEDFELTASGTYYYLPNAVTGWTVESCTTQGNLVACGTPPAAPGWIPGSPEFSIVTTPILGNPTANPFTINNVTIPNSPLGGTQVARLNDAVSGFTVTRMTTTFPVTQANALFQFAYAGSWDGSGHACCDQPFFTINMFDCVGAPLGCSSVSLTPPGPACQNGVTGYSLTQQISWCNWQVKYIDLTPYIGSCVTMQIVNGDCNGGAHHGTLYFDAKCGGSLICANCSPPTGTAQVIAGPVSFCSGSGIAQICAPTGYASYSWTAPAGSPVLAASQVTLPCISITGPVPGAVYTVNLVSPSGCLFVSTNTIVSSAVNIAGIGSSPSCAGGASGTATVVGNGSGAGYNYTWLNSTNSVVSTASIATGLAAGVYTVGISGLGAAGCGSAVSTVTVATAPPGVINLLKPYCGSSAYFLTPGGTNYQWYNGVTAIAAPAGTASSYTVSNPTNGQVLTLTYLSNQGCQDSIRYTMAQTSTGFVAAQNISLICPNATNGTALVNIATAQGAPLGMVTTAIASTGTMAPYSYTSGPNSTLSHQLTGLAAGVYTMNVFDGSCFYTNSFSVSAYQFNYNVTPASATLCPGNNMQLAVVYTVNVTPGQYTYNWSPTPNFGGTSQNAIITPTIPVGTQTTIIYSVVVTPTLINCPLTKSLSVTIINPATPTFVAIPNMCNTFAPYQIIANPPGGVFTSLTGTNPVSPGGLISPSLAANGPNSFTYVTTTYTCVASNMGSYNVSKFWTAALSSTVPPLCITNQPFNLMNIVQNTQNGLWSDNVPGSGGPVNGNFFSPAGLATAVYSIVYTTTSTPIAGVCDDTFTTTVAVTHTSTPTIDLPGEFCTNGVPFMLSATPSGGGWSSPTGVSLAGLVTPNSFNNIFIAPVIYTVTDGPCVNTNSINLNISTFRSAGFTGGINDLCYNSLPVNLMSVAQNTVGTWAMATASLAGAVQNNFFSVQGLTTNTYAITYSVNSIPNPICPDEETLIVSVLNPTVPSITQVGPLCNNGNPIQLAVSPPNSGQWTTSPFLNSAGIFDPSLSSVGSNPVQYVAGTSTCSVEKTIFVSIEAFVPATILNNIPDLCNNNSPINLSPFTLSNQGVWSGTGITGTSFDPAIADAGSFILTHQTSSSPSGLCPDLATIAVNVYSLAPPQVAKAGPFCSATLPVQLDVSPVGGLFSGALPGLVSSGGSFNPGLAVVGTNLVTYSVTSGPCIAYAQTFIDVEAFVSADFAREMQAFCKQDAAVNMNSMVQNPNGTWSGPGIIGSMFNPSLANIGKTNVITYEIKSVPLGLCTDNSTVVIEVRGNPTITVTHSELSGCVPFDFSFNTPNVNSGEGIWTINSGSESITGFSGNYTFDKAGEYTLQFDYKDDIGCKASPTKINSIVAHEAPKVDFTFPDEIYISEPRIQLTNQTSVLTNNKYQWKITGLPQNNEVNPIVTFPKTGKYQVTLIAVSLYNCQSEMTKTIEVKNNFNIFIPNSFSPNFDGLNDVFIPVFTKEGLDTKGYEMEIFDRWGHTLFHTKDVTKGWDGTIQNKGEQLKEEVYIYRIKYKDMDGNAYNKMGHLSLVK